MGGRREGLKVGSKYLGLEVWVPGLWTLSSLLSEPLCKPKGAQLPSKEAPAGEAGAGCQGPWARLPSHQNPPEQPS